eukprot:12711422-Prorocentrum_lima.AAC.1
MGEATVSDKRPTVGTKGTTQRATVLPMRGERPMHDLRSVERRRRRLPTAKKATEGNSLKKETEGMR